MTEPDDDDFAALLAASETDAAKRKQRLRAGEVVRGRVISVGATTAFVAVGGKAEAAIDVAEFRDPGTGTVSIKEGDEIEATVVDDGSRSGSIVLKRVAGRGSHLPGELEQAFANRIPVEGVVTGEIKGGYEVQLGSVRAFCPGSQIDRRRVEGRSYVGQRFRFRITKLEGGGRNAVVSGTVTSLRDFGAFVDLGGVEGLIHVSEIGPGRVTNPGEVLQVGQQVE